MNSHEQTIKTWTAVGFVFAGLYTLVAIWFFAGAHHGFGVLMGVAAALIAILFWMGSFLGRSGNYGAASITYLIGGIIGIPLGIVMILASGKIRQAAQALGVQVVTSGKIGQVPEAEGVQPVAQVPTMGVFGRMMGVLVNPGPTFRDITQTPEMVTAPKWLVPLIVLTVMSLAVSIVMAQRVNWEHVVQQSIEQNPRAAQLSAEQRAQQAAIGVKIARVSVYVFGTLGATIAALFLALVFLGAFNLLAGAGVRFSTSFSITAHALLPSLISSILGIVVLFVKDPDTIDPNNLLATNLGAMLSGDTPKWLVKLAASVDLFWIWIILLIAVGFAAASPKKLSLGKAFGIAFGVYLAFRLIVVGWAAAFS